MNKSTVNVYFLISGEGLKPTEITEKLSLKPTGSWMKGDPIPGKNRCRVDSCWFLGTGDEESLDITEQFSKVFTILHGKQSVLVDMACDYDFEYQFNVVVQVENGIKPAMNLDRSLIKEINKLNASVDFDLYIYS
ncbi:DUF4279 domain-containing protein [Cedecea sp.]|jgi:hypothetical protein|uniref:DUF4279 domain-containing protein n=1 Tax=Cedecea sp. TaxID=1970739 RepID=UPI0012AE7AF5|nr:DUF4279 domain-containing protein [Enterobacteriaceae bacterium RIT693]